MAVRIDPIKNIPNKNSLDTEWIMWHKALKALFGKKQANLTFLKAWKRRNVDGLIFDGKANTVELREYVEKEGFKVESGYLGYAADFVDDTTDWFGSWFGTAHKVSIAIGLIIFGLIIWAIIRIIRKPNEYTEALTSIATRGMSAAK